MRVTKSKRGLTVGAKLGQICPLYYSTSGPTTALYAFRSTAATRERVIKVSINKPRFEPGWSEWRAGALTLSCGYNNGIIDVLTEIHLFTDRCKV